MRDPKSGNFGKNVKKGGGSVFSKYYVEEAIFVIMKYIPN